MSAKKAYVFFNPHPKNEYRDDCVKRALVKITGKGYDEISDGLREHRKITGVRCYNDGLNPHSYAVNVVGLTHIIIEKSDRISVKDFCECYPVGKYIVNTNGHWAAIVDGILYDTFDCSDFTVYSYYK
ncbi:MAG: hypothetical protein J6B55_04600 [Clostridia bacterium]|nr:hypothetical protein [Clostridia bacterium]